MKGVLGLRESLYTEMSLGWIIGFLEAYKSQYSSETDFYTIKEPFPLLLAEGTWLSLELHLWLHIRVHTSLWVLSPYSQVLLIHVKATVLASWPLSPCPNSQACSSSPSSTPSYPVSCNSTLSCCLMGMSSLLFLSLFWTHPEASGCFLSLSQVTE